MAREALFLACIYGFLQTIQDSKKYKIARKYFDSQGFVLLKKEETNFLNEQEPKKHNQSMGRFGIKKQHILPTKTGERTLSCQREYSNKKTDTPVPALTADEFLKLNTVYQCEKCKKIYESTNR